MKNTSIKIKIILSLFILTISTNILAKVEIKKCKVVGTTIKTIETEMDGGVYIYTDKSNDCGCKKPNLITFNVDEVKIMGKLWYASVLTAKSLGQNITAEGNKKSCSDDGAEVYGLNID